MAQWVKNLPALQELQEAWVQALGCEDPLEMVTHSGLLAWEVPWTEEPGRVGHDWSDWACTHAMSSMRESSGWTEWKLTSLSEETGGMQPGWAKSSLYEQALGLKQCWKPSWWSKSSVTAELLNMETSKALSSPLSRGSQRQSIQRSNREECIWALWRTTSEELFANWSLDGSARIALGISPN